MVGRYLIIFRAYVRSKPRRNHEILQETYKQVIEVFEQQYMARQDTLSCESGLHSQSHTSLGSGKLKRKGMTNLLSCVSSTIFSQYF